MSSTNCNHKTSWVLTVLSVYSFVFMCHACPRGYFWDADSSQCQPCAPGSFQHSKNATNCILCEAGKYHTITGAQSELVCRFCPPGTFSAAGSSSCTPCPEGTTSSERSPRCVTCPKGTFVYSWGLTMDEDSCHQCSRGYADEENLLECKSCLPGHAAPPGSTSLDQCSPCPAGTYSDGNHQCYECQFGTFSGPAASKCISCPAGSVSEKGMGSTRFTPCQPGQYGRLAPQYRSSYAANCFNCPQNTTSYAPGRRFCRRPNLPCPRGYIQTSTGDCEMCDIDERYDLEQERCVPCDRTEGSVGGLPLQCAPCADVIKAGVEKSHCMPSYFYSRLAFFGQTCVPGTYIHDIEFCRFCLPCEPGFFSSELNSILCTRCPNGTASSYYGSTKCEPCPDGLTPNQQFTECVNSETGCTIDTQLALVHQDHALCVPKECSVHGDGSYSCPPCFNSSSGIYSVEGCGPCPGNQVRSQSGANYVCGCRGRRAENLGIINGICSECPAGSYGRSTAEGEDNACVQCPSGTYREVATRERIMASLCSRCDRIVPCKKCSPGFVAREAGSTECEQCPPGTFSYGIGDTECLSFGRVTAPVEFNHPLDLNVKRELEQFPDWWQVFQTE